MKKLSIQLLVALLLTTCAKNTDEILSDAGQETDTATHTIVMNLDGDIQQFDQTRATTTFANGTTMFIFFTNSDGSSVYGYATYNSSKGNWELTYRGNLNNQTNSACTLYYFVNPVQIRINSEEFDVFVDLNTSSISYKGTGTFSKSSSSLNVTCTLNPNCSRIRFKGTSGKTIKITGLGYRSSLSMNSTTLAIYSIKPTYEFTSTVESSGYTPYIYYNNCADNISIIVDGTTYTMETPSDMKSNDSKIGYITIPISTNHAGWTIEGVSTTGSHAGHDYVDLGLPSGLKWAIYNVGADTPEDYGDYYAWGETATKTNYCRDTYKYYEGDNIHTKYCTDSPYGTVDNKTVLDLEDDAAHVNWGGSWRMPTKAEQDELREMCTWTWTSQNGVNGYKVSSNINGNYLFLPAAGYRYFSSPYNVSSRGNYWSSSLVLNLSYLAYDLSFFSSDVYWGYDYRYYGRSVRAVCP